MISSGLKNEISQLLARHRGTPVDTLRLLAVGGGSINQTYQVQVNEEHNFFCKVNSLSKFPGMFDSEKAGIELLASRNVIRLPAVIGTLIYGDHQILLMEWIRQGKRSDKFWKRFGEQLAALHSLASATAGLDADNYMGALPQFNQPSPRWTEFFVQQRLEPQVKLAFDKGLLSEKYTRKFENVYKSLPSIFPINKLSLLHGDLWSGNFLCDEHEQPVLIDPAVYNGDPAMDLAMTTLFGGFDRGFYDAYAQVSPLPGNYVQQWEICNLYPLLIHLNLFGTGYLAGIVKTIEGY